MGEFVITGPDGKKYKVTGDNPQGALAALKKSLGVNEVATAPVITPEQRAANVAANAGRQAEIDGAGKIALRDPGALASAASGAMDGLTFGLSDEMTGGAAVNIGMIEDMLSGNFSGMMDRSGQRYDSARDNSRQLLDDATAARPKTVLAGQVLGGAVPAIATGGGAMAATGASLTKRAGLGAAIGAGEGTAYGFGSGEGGLQNRAIEAGKGAAVGGLSGAAAPVAIAGITKGANAAIDAVGGVLPFGIGSVGRSNRAMQTALARSGMTVDQVDEAVKAAAREGQPTFTIADALGNPGQRELSKVARQPGDGRKEIVDFLMNRQNGQARRIGPMIADALDAPDTAAQRTARLTAERGATADTAYAAARGNAAPVDVRPALAAIDDRIGGMKGSGVAGDSIDGKLAGYRSRLAAQPGPDGVMRELSDFDRVLGVKQAVQDDIGAAVRAGRNNEARELGKLQSALDEALEGSSDMYRTANDGFRDASRVIDQIDAGKAATSGRVRSADILDAYGKLTTDQQGAFKAGYADTLLAKVEGGKPGVNKAPALMDDATTAELTAMAKDPALLQRQIGRESTMFETATQATGGPRTADNLQDIMESGKFDTGMLVNLLSGRFGTAASQLLPRLAGQTDATRAKIAKMLLSTDARGVLAPIAKKTENADAAKRVIEAVVRSGAIRAGQ